VDKEKVRRKYVDEYRAQLQFITGGTKRTVERILATSPQPPVIILQADHGPGSVLNWDDPEPADLAERFAILNAYHIPKTVSGFSESLSPVNSFRYLSDQLFATDYGLLPNRSWFSTITKPWRFFDADSPATYMASGAKLRVSIVAYRWGRRPADPATYCRRLAAMQYKGATIAIDHFFVQETGESPEMSATGAYADYRAAVTRGEIPDLGTRYESYIGPGPDRNHVTALFFTSER